MTDGARLKKVAKGSGLFMMGSFGQSLLRLAVTLLVVRFLAPEQVGLIALGYVMWSIIGRISGLGVHQGLARFIARVPDRSGSGSVVGSAMVLFVVTSLAGGVGLYASAGRVGALFGEPELADVLRTLAFGLPASAVSLGLVAVFQGFQRVMPKVVFLDLGENSLRLMIVAPVLFMGLGLTGVLHAYVLANWVIVLAFGAYAYLALRERVSLKVDARVARELVAFSFPLIGVGLMRRLSEWGGTGILGALQSAREVGLYTPALRLAGLLNAPLLAVNFTFNPVSARLLSQGKTDAVQRLYISATKWSTLLTIPAAAYFVVDADAIVVALFGQAYAASADILRVLTLGYAFHVLSGPNGATLISAGFPKTVLVGTVVAVALSLGLSVLLVPSLAGVGTAIAVGTGIAASNVLQSWFLYRRTGIHPISIRVWLPVVAVTLGGLLSYAVLRSGDGLLWHLLAILPPFALGLLATLHPRLLTVEDLEMLDALERKLTGRSRLVRRLARSVPNSGKGSGPLAGGGDVVLRPKGEDA